MAETGQMSAVDHLAHYTAGSVETIDHIVYRGWGGVLRMSCDFCRYTDQDEVETHLNENIYSDDDLMVCFMYDGGLSVWLNHDGVLCCSKYVPVNYCPMCGRKLYGKD